MTTELLAVDRRGLEALMSPENIVIIGATDKGPTDKANKDLLRLGYTGPVYPVNPRRAELWGRTCYESLNDVPERPATSLSPCRPNSSPPH